MSDLDSVHVLHPLQLSVKQSVLAPLVLHLANDRCVHVINLNLDLMHLHALRLDHLHAVLDSFLDDLQVDIQGLSNGGIHLCEGLLDYLFLEGVETLSEVHRCEIYEHILDVSDAGVELLDQCVLLPLGVEAALDLLAQLADDLLLELRH